MWLTAEQGTSPTEQKMTTPFGNNTRSEECDSPCFSGQATSLFTQHYAYKAPFEKLICASDL
jgi:hypothetical protein